MPTTLRSTLSYAAAPLHRAIPWTFWSALAAVAILGSLLYGSSLSAVIPEWTASHSALWLTVSAGLAWVIFVPILWRATKLPLVLIVQASLITMAAGEVVLACGALLNGMLWWIGMTSNAGLINGLVVGCSNFVMAVLLAGQLQRAGVKMWKTLLCWMLVLNGSGAVFFAVFRSVFLH